MAEYANKLKYERAKAESNVSGELIETIYLRLGGKLVGDVKVSVPRETEDPVIEAARHLVQAVVAKKAKKAAKKK